MHPNVSDEGAAAALHITAKEALFELSEVSQFHLVFFTQPIYCLFLELKQKDLIYFSI